MIEFGISPKSVLRIRHIFFGSGCDLPGHYGYRSGTDTYIRSFRIRILRLNFNKNRPFYAFYFSKPVCVGSQYYNISSLLYGHNATHHVALLFVNFIENAGAPK